MEFKKIEYNKNAGITDTMTFKYYNPTQVVMDKTMEDHLKFAMSYWHTFSSNAADMFGEGTITREWDAGTPLEVALKKVDVAFEFMSNLQIKYFCFHDKDLYYEDLPLDEYFKNLDIVIDRIEEQMAKTGIKLLWGTCNAFSEKEFVHGAATSCQVDVFAYAAAKVKNAIDITKRLNGEGYVFWGGREGYETLLNTNMELELNNLANFLTMSRDYCKEIGFDGQLLIEPKPKEPTKHQYDFDCATVYAFLQKYDLQNDFKMNIEVNHATLAGHTIEHEVHYSRINGILGSIDANYGDLLLGWDTDQFPTNLYDATLTMLEILKNGGLPVGINFDAKVRRASVDVEDLYAAYVAGMDTFAKGLLIAARIIEDGLFDENIENRYSSYKSEIGQKIVNKTTSLTELQEYAMNNTGKIEISSGKQETLENWLNRYILEN